MIPEGGFFAMLLGATLGVQLVMAFLVTMSLWSWTIIFHKLILYRRTKRQVSRGYALFNDAADLSEGLQAVSRDEGSPLASVGLLAVGEFRKLEKADIERDRKRMLVKDTLRRVLRQGVSEEMRRLAVDFGVREVVFTDSVFNDPHGHYLALAEELARRPTGQAWSAFLQPRGLGREELSLLVRSGLKAVELGTDAASEATLAGLGKHFDFGQVADLVA